MCFFTVSAKTEWEADNRLKTHTCPWYGGGKTTLSWGVMSDHFLLPMWRELDELLDKLKADEAELGGMHVALRGEVRGLCRALSILMPPFFTTVKDVAMEANKRWEKRQAGEDYETPGIGRLKFQRPPGADLITPSGIPRTPEFDPTAPKHRLPKEAVEKILAASKAGFTPDMLAPAYGVTEAVIKGIIRDGR